MCVYIFLNVLPFGASAEWTDEGMTLYRYHMDTAWLEHLYATHICGYLIQLM